MKKFIMFLLVMAAIIAVSTPSNALLLTIDDGAGGLAPLVINDNGPMDGLSAPGQILYAGSYGGFSLLVSTGISSMVNDIAGWPLLHLNSVQMSSSKGGTLNLILSDTFTDLNPKVSGFMSEFSWTTAGTVSLKTKLDSIVLADMGPFSGSSDGISETDYILPQDPKNFTLTLDATIVHKGAGITSFDAEVSAVPEPGTLMLLGSGLAGVGFYTRRRRK